MNNAINTREWIPVEEKLFPEDNWDVLVSGETYDGDPVVCIGRYYPASNLWETDDLNCKTVYAWMEKPDSYQRRQ